MALLQNPVCILRHYKFTADNSSKKQSVSMVMLPTVCVCVYYTPVLRSVLLNK